MLNSRMWLYQHLGDHDVGITTIYNYITTIYMYYYYITNIKRNGWGG